MATTWIWTALSLQYPGIKTGEQHHASTVEDAWEVVEMLSQGYLVRQICQVLECTRSTYDYQPRHCDNATPQAAIVRLTET